MNKYNSDSPKSLSQNIISDIQSKLEELDNIYDSEKIRKKQ